ncbi:glycerol-3-phosphate dehydrogenase/oxidase [Paracoccus sp. PAR01]|uniref:glycerol-3-phosphate dehydrogenase/oxidase n=1 Tax=Paracoccus sp. PAR01 TaxID=2769282 RepID=UPI001781F5CA|nr:glycerol-3-phosphate dehydrogenase/oxidase [Paracoccus sp. PAR01]MBD9529514.1 glycerol-3-phosphate dehydrogenase/oxidase [Paracoccus sp. PAR01]
MSRTRADEIESLRRDSHFDVLVVGGGINGIGVFRELALQGLRVLLVERQDFCSGCSAAPSRMIHGGLRYLENGEVGLVRESLAERDNLLRNAPHLVHPLPTTVPVASRFSGISNAISGILGAKGKPQPRGMFPIRVGLMLYDLISYRNRLLPRHRIHSAAETRRLWPALTPDARWSATYHDGWISHPERLGMELILDTATAAPKSVALNYASIAPSGTGFILTDLEGGETLAITADLIVNATGAWLDKTAAELGGQAGTRLVSGTKGSHLIIDNPALLNALNGHMIYFENADGRVCITFPYLGRVLAGSTDIRVERPGRTRCDEAEADYILDSLRLVFPGIALDPGQIVFSYSGIRPLPASDHDFTGRISRGHFTRRIDGSVPQICMVGGKWTTFRAFAEQVADEVLAELNLPRQQTTDRLAIGGGRDHPGVAQLERSLQAEFRISAARAKRLATIYGTRARDLLAYSPDETALSPNCPLSRDEVLWLARQERLEHLSDLILRRSDLAITGVLDARMIQSAADILAEAKGWDPTRRRAEIAALIDELACFHGVSHATLTERVERNLTPCVSAPRPA